MQYQEVWADQFVLHKRHKSPYKDEVANAVQCNTRRFLLEYINKLGRAPDTELLNNHSELHMSLRLCHRGRLITIE